MLFDILFQHTIIIALSVSLYFLMALIHVYLIYYLSPRMPFGWHTLMVYYYWKHANEDP